MKDMYFQHMETFFLDFVRASVIERADCFFFDEDLGWWRAYKSTNRMSVKRPKSF